jgi:hypothetical protein
MIKDDRKDICRYKNIGIFTLIKGVKQTLSRVVLDNVNF